MRELTASPVTITTGEAVDLRAFKIIEKAESRLVKWARRQGISLHRVELIAAFEEWSRLLSVLVFYERDTDVERYAGDGTSKSIEDHFLKLLRKLNYPFDKFPDVSFTFDSHERVEREYGGSYFRRTR